MNDFPVDLPLKNRAYWIDWQLDNWARWMRGGEIPEGLPQEGCGGVTGFTHTDNDGSCELMDITLAEATNAAIDGLESIEQAAIYRAYDVIAVFSWARRRGFVVVLDSAKENVGKSLERRGIWLGA